MARAPRDHRRHAADADAQDQEGGARGTRRGPAAEGAALTPGRVRPVLRERNEFDLVARHAGEPAFAPVVLRLFDPLPARGDEVPPDMTRAVERRAADHGDAAR